MPNRYIKETCVTSPTLTALSDAGERFFWRLTTVADDYGRFDGNPAVLQGRCVPTLYWPRRRVEMCLDELCTLVPGDEAPLVQLYQVRGRIYGHLTNWKIHQRDRTKEKDPPKPKFPSPDEGTPLPQNSAATRGDLRQNAALNESESESVNESESESVYRTTPHSAADEFDALWERYPKKAGKKAARKAWENTNGSRPSQEVLLTAIEQQMKSVQWRKNGGEFIPHLSTWLNGQR
jgi:hypothetical protein